MLRRAPEFLSPLFVDQLYLQIYFIRRQATKHLHFMSETNLLYHNQHSYDFSTLIIDHWKLTINETLRRFFDDYGYGKMVSAQHEATKQSHPTHILTSCHCEERLSRSP
jgi:N-formylglutamate amidohydrolase